MSLTIGELVGYLKLDDSQYNAGLDRAEQRMASTGSRVESTGKRMGGAMASAGKAAATALTAASAAAGGLAVSAFKGGISYNALQQSSRAALTAILKGSTAANEQMDKLDAFAKNSPFAKQVFIRAQQQLLGFGLAADKAIPALDAIQNAVAAVGGSNDDISNVTDALAKMMGSGKLAGDTLNRLGEYGIDAAGIIGKSMGMTGAEIREMASKPGGIPADQVWDVLIDGLQERFGGAAANVKKTWAGATDRIKGAWRDIGSALAEPFAGHKGGGMAIEWVNKIADAMRAVEKKVGPVVNALMPRFTGGLSKITPALEKIKATVDGLDMGKLGDGLDRIGRTAPAIAGVGTAMTIMSGKSIPVLGAMLGGINPVVAGILAMVAASPDARAAMTDLFTAVSPLVESAAKLAEILARSLSDGLGVVARIVQSTTPLVSGLADGMGLLAKGFDMLPDSVQSAIVIFGLMRLALGRFQDHIAGPVTTALRGFGDNMRLQASLAQMEGKKIGNVGAVISVGISRGVAGAKAALVGLKNALGGGWGIAIGLAATAVSALASAHAEAKQRVEDYTEAIKADSGALGENTKAAVVNTIQKEGVDKLYEKMGGNLSDLTKAILGEEDAIARVNEVTGRYRAENERRLTQDGKVATGAYQGAQANATLYTELEKVRGAIRGANSEINESRGNYERYSKLMEEGGASAAVSAVAQDALRAGIDAVANSSATGTGDVDGMGGAIKGLGGEAKDAKTQLKELKDMIDSFAGGERALRANDRQVRQAIRDATEAAADKGGANPKAIQAQNTAAANLKRAQERLAAAQKSGKGILSAQQAVSRAQEAYAKATKHVKDTMKDATKAQDEYEAKLDSLAAAGEDRIKTQVTEAQSLKDIVDGYNETRNALIKVVNARGIYGKAAEKEVDQIFLTKQELDGVIAKYGELHPEVVTQIVTKGGDKAIAQIETVKGTIDGVPRIVDIKIGIIDAGVHAAIKGITQALGPLGMPFNVLNGIGGMTRRAKGGKVPGYAGGTIIGPGTGVSDSIPAYVRETGRALAVSNGEFISTAYSTRKNQAALEAGNQGATLTVADQGQHGMDLASIDTLARAIGRELVAALPNARLSVSADSAVAAMWRR